MFTNISAFWIFLELFLLNKYDQIQVMDLANTAGHWGTSYIYSLRVPLTQWHYIGLGGDLYTGAIYDLIGINKKYVHES